MAKTITSKWLVTLTVLLLSSETYGDQEDAPVPWILSSGEGHVFFAMYPPLERDGENVEGHGVCYRLVPDGTLKELWRVSGWYMFTGYLSDSGEHLVRFGLWAKDLKAHSDLAIAFYKNGQLLKAYRVNELIKDPKLLEDSTSHYRWLATRQTESDGIEGSEFEVTLIDKTVYYFDLNTGEIIDTDVDPKAAGDMAVFREEHEDEL